MEMWAREEILKHNAVMDAAYNLVVIANQYCSNSKSERIEVFLAKYNVCPETGNMKVQEVGDE